MRRSAALLGILFSYWIADAICRAPFGFEGGWARMTVPPLVLLTGSLLWLRFRPIRFRVSLVRCPPAIACIVAAVGFAIVAIGTQGNGPSSGGPGVLESLSLLSIVPIAEELYFRGALLDHLKRKLGTPVAVGIVSLLFGLLHAHLGTAVVMIVLSLLLSVAVITTRSLFWAVALHALWNALAVVRMTPSGERRIGLAVTVCALAWMMGVAGLLTKRKVA